MPFEFRYAKSSDLENIVRTYNSTIASGIVTADTKPVTVESKKAWFDQHNTDKRPLWIVENDMEYAGWISFNSFYGRPAYDRTVEISIYLDPDQRGKNIGKSSLSFAIDEARKRGIKNLLGFIFAQNKPSVELFHKFHFEEWGRLPGVAIIENKPIDLLILGLKLENE